MLQLLFNLNSTKVMSSDCDMNVVKTECNEVKATECKQSTAKEARAEGHHECNEWETACAASDFISFHEVN